MAGSRHTSSVSVGTVSHHPASPPPETSTDNAWKSFPSHRGASILYLVPTHHTFIRSVFLHGNFPCRSYVGVGSDHIQLSFIIRRVLCSSHHGFQPITVDSWPTQSGVDEFFERGKYLYLAQTQTPRHRPPVDALSIITVLPNFSRQSSSLLL